MNSSSNIPTFLTVNELAARWKMSVRNMRRLIARGDLPVHRFGRLIRISLKDVVVFEVENRLT
jgi:excisionase family DNA binding protein